MEQSSKCPKWARKTGMRKNNQSKKWQEKRNRKTISYVHYISIKLKFKIEKLLEM